MTPKFLRSKKGKEMLKERRPAITHGPHSDYRCPKCSGRGVIEGGRVRVNHRLNCEIRVHLLLTHPRFVETIQRYRSNPN